MAKFKTAKDILNSYDFLEAREKTQRYVKHEFQDYAYRLASDLGDVQHKAIYMKLAKTVDRTLLEQAAVFALEYFHEPNKGKVFMWKLSQLRSAIQDTKDQANFDHDFVMKRMGKLYDELSKEYFAKHEADFKQKSPMLKKVLGEEKRKAYLCGVNSGYEALLMSQNNCVSSGYDVSRAFIDAAKKLTGSKKFVRKFDASQLTKPASLDVIYALLWPIITLETETKYLNVFAQALRPSAKLIIEVPIGKEPGQKWVKFSWKDQEYSKFEKVNELHDLSSKLISLGFNVDDILEVSPSKSLVVAVRN